MKKVTDHYQNYFVARVLQVQWLLLASEWLWRWLIIASIHTISGCKWLEFNGSICSGHLYLSPFLVVKNCLACGKSIGKSICKTLYIIIITSELQRSPENYIDDIFDGKNWRENSGKSTKIMFSCYFFCQVSVKDSACWLKQFLLMNQNNDSQSNGVTWLLLYLFKNNASYNFVISWDIMKIDSMHCILWP